MNAQTQPARNTTLWRLIWNVDREYGHRLACSMLCVGDSMCRCLRSFCTQWQKQRATRKEFEKRIRVIFQLDQDMFSCCTAVLYVIFCVLFLALFFFVLFFSFLLGKKQSLLVSSLFAFVRRLLFIHWFSSHRYFTSFSHSEPSWCRLPIVFFVCALHTFSRAQHRRCVFFSYKSK